MMVSMTTLYFAYIFIEKKDTPLWTKLIFGTLLLSFTIFIPTHFNLTDFDVPTCGAVQGPLVRYFYGIEIFTFLWLLFYLFKKFITVKGDEKGRTRYFSVGVVFFLASFSGTNIFGSIAALININNPGNWDILQYGLFGMPVFMACLVYIITKYKEFDIKLIATQALVVSMIVLIGSQFFYIITFINKILTGITLLLSCAGGYMLVRSVKAEVRRREQLARLNTNLQNLIKQRESLVHLITHKVKGSFTHSKYIFAEILEGTFGEITPKIRDIVQQGLDSDNEGLDTVDLVLNAANLQSGRIKYDMKPIDFKKIVEEIINSKKGPAKKKGLRLKVDIKDGNYTVLGDVFWLKEAVLNLIDNSVKYTLAGSIKIKLRRLEDKVFFSVKDTGVGITDEDEKNLFKEGGKGKDSSKINVDSTGYGLYTVKLVIQAHQGKIWEKSDGQNKGSAFYIELPGKN